MNETDEAKIKKIAVVLNGGESLEKKYNQQLIQIIAAQLVRYNFEVINTHAFPRANETEIEQITFKDNINLCKIYATDAIIVVTPEVTEKDDDGMFCKLGMAIHSWGYDLNGYDLGIAVNKSYSYAGRSCKDAFFKTIKELGYLTGREMSLVLD
ncbi:MAG: NAD(P)H-dependent oxidoreductase [Bacteroidetes bacterium]|nr:NAD(P)H-dependent oxidoreductase [Bacteroidota bacterium]